MLGFSAASIPCSRIRLCNSSILALCSANCSGVQLDRAVRIRCHNWLDNRYQSNPYQNRHYLK